METLTGYKMVTSEGVATPLLGVKVEAVFKGTALQATIFQHQQNAEEQVIDAVYSGYVECDISAFFAERKIILM